jgi:hypothetical protein
MIPTKRVTAADVVSERISTDNEIYRKYLYVAAEVLHEARRYYFEREWKFDAAVAKFTAAGSVNEVIKLINDLLDLLPTERSVRFGLVSQEHELPYDGESRHFIPVDPE